VLTERVNEASHYVPMDRLGLSPQCGFASSVMGNKISPDDQRKKLALVVKTAQALWD
jgi:5-methyltetrahydropteroyltriglutamate--homocysteine methyltransferase